MDFDNDATPLPIGQSRTKTKLNSSRRCCDIYYAVRPPSPRHDPPNIKCLLLRNNWHYFVKTVHCARVHFVVSYFIFNAPFGAWWGIYLHSEYSTFEAFVKWNFCTFDTDTLPNDRHS